MAGVCFLIFGVYVSDQRLDSSNSNYFVPRGSGLAGLAIALLAYPLYIVLRNIKRKKTSHK